MYIKSFISVLILLSLTQLNAQNTLQVVTRSIQKTVPCKSGYNVEINAEKAEIEVRLGQNADKHVHINAEMVARHARLDSAKADLESWKFLTNTSGKTIYVRAYIGLGKKQSLPSSNLKAKIVISLPANCGVVVTNKFGKMRIENLSGDVRLNGEFCGVFLNNISGNVTLLGNYGSLEASNIEGTVDIKSKRAEIAVRNMAGNCSIRSEYGNVFIDAGDFLGNLNVQAAKCDVTMDAQHVNKHNFQLIANHGRISTPSRAAFDTSGSGNQTQRADLKVSRAIYQVKVVTDFGKITIR
jgi:hypothetical protein